MVAVGDNIGVAIEGKERRQLIDPFEDIASDKDAAIGGEVVRDEQP